MVECGAKEVSEELMVSALEFGHQSIQPIIDLQEKMACRNRESEKTYTSFAVDESLQAQIMEKVQGVSARYWIAHL